MLLEAQVTLTGEKVEYDKERVETWKDVIKGKFFQITVSEEMHSKLDSWHENGKNDKIRRWISAHMKPYANLPELNEGLQFQTDLELFVRIL